MIDREFGCAIIWEQYPRNTSSQATKTFYVQVTTERIRHTHGHTS